MSSIDSPPAREKFSLLDTVVNILLKPLLLRWYFTHASLKKLCATLIGFTSAELELCHGFYEEIIVESNYTNCAEAESLVPEPILSHRLANVAILCMKYLHRLNFDTLQTRNKFWATRSKQLPWLWRRRMRVTLMRPRRPIWDHDGHKCLSLLKLRRSRQIIHSGTIQSHQKQRLFYTCILDLLCYTLRKAMKSDMLTTALSKLFIPSLAPILLPRCAKHVRKAAAAYLKKVSRIACLGISDDEPLHS